MTAYSIREDVLEIIQEIKTTDNIQDLEYIRVKSLGKKGLVTQAMKGLKNCSGEEKKQLGQTFNQLKTDILKELEERRKALQAAELEKKLSHEKVDVTLPVQGQNLGAIHPISQTIEEVAAIFGTMGFSVVEGPDIEDNFHNFTALNIPEAHPARQMHDTFYLPPRPGEDSNMVLRTHTSPVQIRTMTKTNPPLRVIIPGRTYRCDYDMTHTPMFHQIEGLVVDTKTNMSHLKGCLIEFCRTFFDMDNLPVRFRPSFFPFTEPSAEVDIGCCFSNGDLKIGEGTDWLEILGCGMVHPNVLKNCGIDSEKHQGFAFGMGVERMAMLKYGIPDLRKFFESDLRWLKHYGFSLFQSPNLARGL